MSGFTKLVPEIIQSSIWNESPEVRCVWIAMIAMKDQDGNLRGNNQTIARMANVPLDWADKALEKFQSPDPYSNNPTNEGRRIEAIPGGWHIVSHELYRAKDYREVEAERKKKYRENKAMSRTCPGHVPDSSASASVSDSVLDKEVKEEERVEKETKPKIEPLTGENFADRSKQANNGRLSSNEIERFVGYWTETNAKGRCRFQAEKFFDIGRRISTWASRLNVDKSVKIQANPANKPLDW